VEPGARLRVTAEIADPEGGPLRARWVLRPESGDYLTGGDFRPVLPDIEGAILKGRVDGAQVRMPREPGAYRLFLYAYDEAGNAATANIPLRVKGEVRTPLPLYVYHDGFEGMPWAPSGWMGSTESLSLDGAHAENCHAGNACIRLHYTGEFSWVGVAWQHPANNWGSQDGGYDLTGARYLELWARGEFGGERVSFGVGLLGEDTAHPDSGKTSVEGIILDREWRRYRVPLRNVDLSSIKTGFVVTLSGQRGPVTGLPGQHSVRALSTLPASRPLLLPPGRHFTFYLWQRFRAETSFYACSSTLPAPLGYWRPPCPVSWPCPAVCLGS
jgi:hypothetical protein